MTACSTIPDRDRAHRRIAGAEIDGRGLSLPEEGRVLAWRMRSLADLGPRGMIFGRPDAENR